MTYEIKGTIIKIFDKQVFGENFEKREFVIKTDEDYPQEIKFETIQKTVPLLDEFEENDEVVIKFNIRGKEHKGNYYNNLSVWKIQKMKDAPEEESVKSKKGKSKKQSLEDDDMPF